MSEFFFNYGLFLIKSITFLVSVVAVVFLSVVVAKAASGGRPKNRVQFIALNDDKVTLQRNFAEDTEDEDLQELLNKEEKKTKDKTKDKTNENPKIGRVFLIDFDGDVSAKSEGNLKEEVEAILSLGKSDTDQVVMKVKSPGGYVHSYGIASEHLKRIKEAGIKLTVCVDEIAASGGYMMACVADKIIAAPFSTIGSIGVVAGIPNVNGLLKKHGVEYEDFTAGEYKRTVTTMGEITQEGRAKFQEDLDTVHEAFKTHVKEHRVDLDVASIATGESWLGRQALEKGLVDEIGTSGRLISGLMTDHKVFEVRYKRKKELSTKLSSFLVKIASSTVGGIHQSLKHQPKY